MNTNNELTFQIPQLAIAIWGAITGTMGLVLSIYNSWSNRARIKIIFQSNVRQLNSDFSPINEKTYHNVDVINKGRRPIRIDKAVMLIKNTEQQMLFRDSFDATRNRVLTEAEPRTTFLVDSNAADQSQIYAIKIQDGTGRIYHKYLTSFPTYYIIRNWIRWRRSKKKEKPM